MIEYTVVAGGAMLGFFGEFGVCEIAEGAEAVVYGYKYDAFFGEVCAVVGGVGTGAAGEGAAVYPYHDGEFVFGVVRSGPDVEVETVFV